MKRKSVWATLLSLAVVAMVMMAAAPAQAVVGGQLDGDGHPNVGELEVQFDGAWYGIGTCTLVGEDVVLTAAHCVDFVVGGEEPLGEENVRVTFDPVSAPGARRYYAKTIEVNPIWWNIWIMGNSKHFFVSAEDEALVWLTEEVKDITPAKIVAAGGLDTLDLTQSTFTVVGYGTNGFVSGSYMSWRNPQTQMLFSGRNYKDVSVVTEHEAFADRYLKITASTGFGDSGGPLFYEGVQVAINTWTSSMRCVAPSFSYRLDAPLAQGFLRKYLDSGHFAPLPQ